MTEETNPASTKGREFVDAVSKLLRQNTGPSALDAPAEKNNSFNAVLASSFEERVESILNKLQMGYIEQHHIQYLNKQDGRMHVYTPDFDLTDTKYNGKTVILEPHGGDYFNYDFIRKMKAFMESKEHDDYYLVIITEMPVEEIKKRLATTMVSKHSGQYFKDLEISDICDKLINTRKRGSEEMAQPYGLPPEMADKPYASDAAKLAEDLGGMGEFDELEFMRQLIKFKREGSMD